MTQETGQFIWLWGSSAVLAVALYFPTCRLVTVARIRRAEKKLERQTTDVERADVRQKTRLIAAIISLCFAYFFTKTLLSP